MKQNTRVFKQLFIHLFIVLLIGGLFFAAGPIRHAFAQGASVWDGSYPTEKPADMPAVVDRVQEVNSAAQFAWLASRPTMFGSEVDTVKLMVDINLDNHPWTPSTALSESNKVLDGNGHTISNLKVTVDNTTPNVTYYAAMFVGNFKQVLIKGLTIDGANIGVTSTSTNGRVFSAVVYAHNDWYGDLENVTVKNATVTGTKYVAALTAYGSETNIKNCTVQNVTLNVYEKYRPDWSRDLPHIGGLVGLNNAGLVTGNTVDGLTINLSSVMPTISTDQTGSLLGTAQARVLLRSNTVSNVTVNGDPYDKLIGLDNHYKVVNVTKMINYATIQGAINAADAKDVIEIEPGTYVENVVINKPLTLGGTDKDTVILLPAFSGSYCDGSSLCDGASNVILVEADNVKIHDLTINGNNPDLDNPRDDAVVNGEDIDARNGIITNHETNPNLTGLEIYNTIIKNIFLRGIYMSTNGEFNFHDNIVSNVAGDYASIGLFAFGGYGKFTNNTVSLTNDAIAANHSKGIEFVGNTVNSSGSGIHTDNSNPGADKFDLIENNTITCGENGYGIFTFAHYQPPKVLNNTLYGCAFGISAWGGYGPEPVIINNNAVNGQDVAGSVGLFVTTSIMNWGYLDINVEATGNTFVNNAAAVEVTADDLDLGGSWVLKDLKLKLAQNNMDLTNTLAVDADNTNPVYVEAPNNWWGKADGPAARYTGKVIVCSWLDAPAPDGAVVNGGTVTNTNTGVEYCSIQAAVDAAGEGHVLEVGPGIYSENVDTGNRIIKGLTVRGVADAEGNKPVVFGSMKFGAPRTVGGDYAQKNLILENLRIEANLTNTSLYGTTRHALWVENFENAQLRNLELAGTEPNEMFAIAYGLSMGSRAKNYTIENVTIENFLIGVYGRSLNLTLSNSDISKVEAGVNIMGGGNLTINGSRVVTEVTRNDKDLYAVRFGEGNSAGTPSVLGFHVANSTLALNNPDSLAPAEGKYMRSVVLRGNAGGEMVVASSNIPQGIYNISSVAITADGNWWGTADKPVAGTNYVGLVEFCSWLNAATPGGTPVFGNGQVKNERTGQIYCSIQSAVDDAEADDSLLVGPGTFEENVLVNKKVKIIGSGNGEDPLVDTIVATPNSFDSKVGLFNLAASGASAEDPLVLRNMRLNPVGQAGISVGRFTESTATNVEFVELDRLKVIGTNANPQTEQERGLFVDSTSSLKNTVIKDSSFDNLAYGVYFMKAVSTETSTVSDLTVTNTTFNHNNIKGIYAEKLNNATFTGVTVSGNGYAAIPEFPGAQAFMSGVDINLKAGTYANIQFIQPIITDNALGGAKNGSGITIKARDDGATYGAQPATLNNVLIEGGKITGNERGIVIGEPGKNNAGPTGVVLRFNRIFGNNKTYTGDDGAAYGGVVNHAKADISALNNWFGCNEGPAGADCDKTVVVTGAGAIDASKWMVLSVALPTGGVEPGQTVSINADLNKNSADEALPEGKHVHNGVPIKFTTDAGTFNPEETTLTAGAATSVFTATNTQPVANVCVKVDNETICGEIVILLGKLTVTDFYYATNDPMKGVSADIKLEEVTTDDAESIVVKLYTGGANGADYVLLQTNTANLVKFNAFTVFTSPFDIFGTRNYEGSSWANVREAEYGQNEIPTRVEAIVTLKSGKILTATKDIPTGEYVVVAVNDAYQTKEDTELVVDAPGLFANDQFATYGTTLEVTDPANGTVTLGTKGGFSYEPNENWHGTDTFTYMLKKDGAEVASATVTITVTPVKDQVVANDDAYEVNQGETLIVTAPGVKSNDVDVDGNQWYVSIVTDVQHGWLYLNPDGSFTYIPDADFSGEDTFVYKLQTYVTPQSQGLWDDTATVTITVKAASPEPTMIIYLPLILKN